MEFSKEELNYILAVLSQVNFRPGQAQQLIMAEALIKKISNELGNGQ